MASGDKEDLEIEISEISEKCSKMKIILTGKFNFYYPELLFDKIEDTNNKDDKELEILVVDFSRIKYIDGTYLSNYEDFFKKIEDKFPDIQIIIEGYTAEEISSNLILQSEYWIY